MDYSGLEIPWQQAAERTDVSVDIVEGSHVVFRRGSSCHAVVDYIDHNCQSVRVGQEGFYLAEQDDRWQQSGEPNSPVAALDLAACLTVAALYLHQQEDRYLFEYELEDEQ